MLFTLGQLGIGWYLGRTSLTSVYAAADSLLVLLICLYYAAQVLVFGAELTWVYVQGRRAPAAAGCAASAGRGTLPRT